MYRGRFIHFCKSLDNTDDRPESRSFTTEPSSKCNNEGDAICLNKGICSIDEGGNVICKCSNEYHGSFCEISEYYIQRSTNTVKQRINKIKYLRLFFYVPSVAVVLCNI